MADYTIPQGTLNWDVPFNADMVDIDARLTTGENTNATQDTQISANTGNISTNTASIATNTSNISTLQGQMITANSNIATNTANIATVTTTANNAVPKDAEVVNVKDHGATGNGIADDTTAIQAAVSTLSSAGGILYFPPGNYLLNGTNPIDLTNPVTIVGAGPGASAIRIGSSFTGTSAITISSDNCQIRDITVRGDSTTTTSNPAAHGVTATGTQFFKVLNSSFQWVNGYAIRALGTASATLHGGQIDNVKIQSCAGGIHIKSDTTNTPANFQMSNVFTRFLGVNSGTNANLDGIRIEDSWDVLIKNSFAWMNATTGGTGSAFRIRGDCAAIFVQNLDALGPQTGTANVLVQGNGSTSPQNVQIQGGVIQQGIVGLLITDATQHVRVENMRILNNQTHGVSIEGTAQSVYIDKCLFSNNGQGATGSNYDINITSTGTDLAFLTYNRHSSGTVSVGTAGIQAFHNVTANTRVRVFGANFAGSTGTVSNWFAGSVLPNAVHQSTAGNNEFTTGITFRATGLTNARIGTATLSGGTVTVSNTSVTANTHIVLTGSTGAVTANAGALFVSAATAGTGFTVKSTNAADTSAFGYILIERV